MSRQDRFDLRAATAKNLICYAARKRELRALLLSEKFKEADMISHIPQSAFDQLVELSLVAVMGLPPKDLRRRRERRRRRG